MYKTQAKRILLLSSLWPNHFDRTISFARTLQVIGCVLCSTNRNYRTDFKRLTFKGYICFYNFIWFAVDSQGTRNVGSRWAGKIGEYLAPFPWRNFFHLKKRIYRDFTHTHTKTNFPKTEKTVEGGRSSRQGNPCRIEEVGWNHSQEKIGSGQM